MRFNTRIRVSTHSAKQTPYGKGRQTRRATVLILACVLLFFACTAPSFASTSSTHAAITVVGNQFFKNGHPWLSGGVNLRPLERAELSNVKPVDQKWFQRAVEHYGPGELEAIRNYGANTVRFQVSQPGLDPRSPGYVAGYLERIAKAVHDAQEAGFMVVLAMQWEAGATGVKGLSHMPDASTMRAWKRLAPMFAYSRDVMYELFNEPNLTIQGHKAQPSRKAWRAWRNAFQPLIGEIRDLGAQNVLIVDGLNYAHTLYGAPTLFDPFGKLAYGVHPYITRGEPTSPSGWDRWFGDFASSHPVIVTEWFMASRSKRFCKTGAPKITRELLSYARRKRIGFIMSAFDVPGILVQNYIYTPTTFKHFHCGKKYDGGPGQAFQTFFLHYIQHR